LPCDVGYAWRGQPSDPSKGLACAGGGTGQLHWIANVDMEDASRDYAVTTCGLPGALVVYNLLGNGTSNFFLDPSDPGAPMIRGITLDPSPVIPLSGNAWGVLNAASDALLLHPAGHVISLSRVNHKI
jgi:hypothetical protein